MKDQERKDIVVEACSLVYRELEESVSANKIANSLEQLQAQGKMLTINLFIFIYIVSLAEELKNKDFSKEDAQDWLYFSNLNFKYLDNPHKVNFLLDKIRSMG